MRIKLVITVFLVVWTILLVRIYQLTIKSNAYYETLATQNIIKKEWILPVRGEILDRSGKPLAINKIGFKILIDPHLSSKKRLPELEKALVHIQRDFPDVNTTKLLKRYKRLDSPYRHDPIVMVRFLPYEKVLPHFTELSRKPHIKIEPTTKRYYPYGSMTAHVIGYVGKANEKDMANDDVVKLTMIAGKSGLEKYYNRFLEGEPGYKHVKVSAFNKQIGVIETVPPKEDRDITLHLDMDLQAFISKMFDKGHKSGAVIVMRKDGAILSAGSYPAYDPNEFVSGISRAEWKRIIENLNHPFTNKLIHGLYPPGSVIKPGVALAFVDSKKVSPYTNFYCNGAIELGKHKFRCWKSEGHEKTDMIKAIRESCDVYFYKGSLLTGIDKIAQELRKMGLGQKTGIDLPNEFIGAVPDKPWKMNKYGQPWYQGETLNAAIGQGYMLVTPMQIARYTALLATGKLPRPSLAESLAGKKLEPVLEDVLSLREKRALPLVRRAMYEVCNHPKGTAYWAMRGTKVKVAGKTGTAQVIGIPQEEKKRMKEDELAYYHRSHAWLTTYAPYKNPQYIVTILVEHGGHGGSAAGPMVKEIYNWLVDHGYIR
ncbi:penicillin-binding protein 2 [Hydrogenimonas cancrithermarum]|uniref:Penicillin-binding protein n=1 Tax=Hydrogenimonas cancrithermarum TaxID=2993563 RepID=A0ABM8FNI9_9BACT|nr:penicillin-binding protein 2 [Hydrogenimonas cancrithermarum]BDY13921.1 penicillin-binding protein [Hydrogenimonas cancrithermarum]